MFERVEEFMGKENLDKIKKTSVLLVGLGGVGGYAMESLIRSGIENIILIDFDKVDITNLNRQIISNNSNIGVLKVDAAKDRILSINPNCHVITENIFLNNETKEVLDKYQFDYIVDACDSLEAKKILIDYAIEHDIKQIASMGTANKIDPTKLAIEDIRKTSYDPLAKKIRKYVADKKTNKKIMVVSTTEVPIRRDKLSSLVFVPAAAGLLIGNYIIKDIINN